MESLLIKIALVLEATAHGSISISRSEMRDLTSHLRTLDSFLERREQAATDAVDKSAFRLARFGNV